MIFTHGKFKRVVFRRTREKIFEKNSNQGWEKSKLHSRYFQELKHSRDLNSCKPQHAHQSTTQKSLWDLLLLLVCFLFFCFFLFPRRVETYYPQLSHSSEQCLLRLTTLLMQFSEGEQEENYNIFSLALHLLGWKTRDKSLHFQIPAVAKGE